AHDRGLGRRDRHASGLSEGWTMEHPSRRLPAAALTTRAALLLILFAAPAAAERAVVPLDQDWRFLRGDAPGAEQRSFDDTAWRAVTVPHDWSIEGPYDAAAAAGRGGGYPPSGVSWYRRRVALPAADSGRR